MANVALDTDNAWDLVLSAINRSNITLPVPGSGVNVVTGRFQGLTGLPGNPPNMSQGIPQDVDRG